MKNPIMHEGNNAPTIGDGRSLTLMALYGHAIDQKIILPTVQRGFVWKPHQIENLWDSLLRGYPIGSFVFSRTTKSDTEFELLDGQQRATSICLGFHNPVEQPNCDGNGIRTYFRVTTENLMVFIDLAKPNPDVDNRKYYIRVITRSHPWGYRRQENQKTLTADNIAKAKHDYHLDQRGYLETPLNQFWPYESSDPIPLGLFVDAAVRQQGLNELEAAIARWRNLVCPKRHDGASHYSIADVFNAVKAMLDDQIVPVMLLDMDKVYGSTDDSIAIPPSANPDRITSETAANDTGNETDDEAEQSPNVEDRSVDEVENLFIRLNSGGTPLRGEELNYSVLKAHMDFEMQTRIEDKCKYLFRPARFITIAYRLFQYRQLKDGITDGDSISMTVKPKQFQRSIRDHRMEFTSYLDEAFLNTDVLEQVRELLTYSKSSNEIGLPRFMVKSLADSAPQIMFMLLYRILIKGDAIEEIPKKRAMGLITLLTWLGRGERQKDHGKLLASIWPCVRQLEPNEFWSKVTLQRAMVRDDNDRAVMTPFPSSKQLVRMIPKDENIRRLTRENLSKEKFGEFLCKMLSQRELVLYAQRKYLAEWFEKSDSYDLDDTSRAFDWDHICPQNAIRRKHNVHQALRDWYSTIGNIRAWPYSLNRQDQDKSPAVKLRCTSEDVRNWRDEYPECNPSGDDEKYLLRVSCCDEEWHAISEEKLLNYIRETWAAKQVLYCILSRGVDLCKEWYEQMGIDELHIERKTPKEVQECIMNVLDARKWSRDTAGAEYQRYNLNISGDQYLYLGIESEQNPLGDGEIEFGVLAYDAVKDEELSLEVDVPKSMESKYVKSEKSFIGGRFTLLAFTDDSMKLLLKDFHAWLCGFPDKEIRQKATESFLGGIKEEYRPQS